MSRHFNPPGVAAPLANYSHAVETPAGARWLHCAGQLGFRPDGTLPDNFAAQAEQAWRNVVAVLAGGNMTIADVVQVKHYLTKPEQVALYRPVVSKYMAEARPASTMLIVQALARPDYLVEIEVVAAT